MKLLFLDVITICIVFLFFFRIVDIHLHPPPTVCVINLNTHYSQTHYLHKTVVLLSSLVQLSPREVNDV